MRSNLIMMSICVRIISQLGRNVIDAEKFYLEIQEILLEKQKHRMDLQDVVKAAIENLDKAGSNRIVVPPLKLFFKLRKRF